MAPGSIDHRLQNPVATELYNTEVYKGPDHKREPMQQLLVAALLASGAAATVQAATAKPAIANGGKTPPMGWTTWCTDGTCGPRPEVAGSPAPLSQPYFPAIPHSVLLTCHTLSHYRAFAHPVPGHAPVHDHSLTHAFIYINIFNPRLDLMNPRRGIGLHRRRSKVRRRRDEGRGAARRRLGSDQP